MFTYLFGDHEGKQQETCIVPKTNNAKIHSVPVICSIFCRLQEKSKMKDRERLVRIKTK